MLSPPSGSESTGPDLEIRPVRELELSPTTEEVSAKWLA